MPTCPRARGMRLARRGQLLRKTLLSGFLSLPQRQGPLPQGPSSERTCPMPGDNAGVPDREAVSAEGIAGEPPAHLTQKESMDPKAAVWPRVPQSVQKQKTQVCVEQAWMQVHVKQASQHRAPDFVAEMICRSEKPTGG